MSASPQLKLVSATEQPSPTDAARRVFEHWAFMLGRNPRRCAFGPVRRQVVRAALELYDEDLLLQAVEGMAADPLDDAASDKMREAMREIEWLLARESRIERWANVGLRLRQGMQQQVDRPEPAEVVPVDPEKAAAGRQALRDLAARMRAGQR